ncbi:sulfatase-like hydrolase/transferase [Fusobacterium sp.]|uniref:sulfatase-like hydrolase/transferase n=1 Tax=Fusobacterium sp. TaxID=68766 RepID=UPI002633F2EE|nr:sulfatase-like hydrolase/transferase [Fusobacterium sp.]
MNKKTNVVFILTDDQGYWSLGSYGNKDVISPTLDKLAEEGVRFDNFFCVSPVCSPARASIFTGRIPSQHGVHDWLDEHHNDTVEYLKGQDTFVKVLAENGYRCGLSGKWHLGNSAEIQQGFSEWYVHEKGGGPYYNAPMYKNGVLTEEPKYITDATTDYGIEFIEKCSKNNEPFYLSLHYTAPHAPWGKEHHPEELLDLYKNCKFESCPRDEYHPWKIRETFEGTEEERIDILKGYFGAITGVDRGVKKVVDKLEELGILEDTLIIFTSDNGMNMGHHGIFGKGNGTSPQNMYETSVKIPMIISHKNHLSKGKVYKGLYSHYDVMPTILQYLGIEYNSPINLPGKSFYEVLNGKEENNDKDVVIFDEYGPVRMIRNKEWKYIHRYPFGPHELYCLKKDPDEKENLIDKEEYQDKIKEMRMRLERWFVKYVNPEIDGAKEPVFGAGQKGLAGVWGDGTTTYERYDSDLIFTCDNRLKERDKDSKIERVD